MIYGTLGEKTISILVALVSFSISDMHVSSMGMVSISCCPLVAAIVFKYALPCSFV